jgi:hypothetical protein
MAGIGHCPQVEAPDRFAQTLLDFSSELAAPAERMPGRADDSHGSSAAV